MPFTLSHPAAILPFCRFVGHPIFIVALIVGSMTPDIGYYFRAFSFATYAHTFLGSAMICIPTGVLLIGGLLIARRPLAWLMPSPVRGVLNNALMLSEISRPAFILQILFWIWIGALTHILWDSFTHRTGWFVERIEFLQASLVIREGYSFPVYYVLQQVSTLIGLLIVVRGFIRVCSRSSTDRLHQNGDLMRYAFWVGLGMVSMILSMPFALEYAVRFEGLLQFRSFVFQMGTLSGAIFAVLALMSLVIVSLKNQK